MHYYYNKFLYFLFFILILVFILFVNGAIPFYALPTLGQAIWATGFSQSFINSSVINIYATNFGQPLPAAMVFGLAGGWPMGTLINLGLHPADAYSTIAAFWLGVAYFYAYKICRFLGVKSIISTMMAGLWLTMPTIWMHAGYSMLSWGIALLSFYYYRTMKLLLNNSNLDCKIVYYMFFYFISIIISIFMDGYSFMMFAVGSSILIGYVYLFMPEYKRNILYFGIPTHFISVLFSYFIYTNYIGRGAFDVSPIDFFRGWGLDLSFITIPSKGIVWLFDILDLSVSRTNKLYFGDESVWVTTFSFPIILVGIFSWWNSRKISSFSSGLLIIAIFSFYMSLGPSLKINSTRTVEMLQTIPQDMSQLMAAELAIMPTGNAWVSENLPGFNSMRASYRWSALGIFMCWLLFSLYLGKRSHSPRNAFISVTIILLLILTNTPNLYQSWKKYNDNRTMFMRIDSELVAKLRNVVIPNELVAFLPYQNDFIVNYIASKLNIRAYNIGGDKNLQEAQKNWPPLMLDSRINLKERVVRLLLNGDASTIIIPYFDTLWAAHFWPCNNQSDFSEYEMKDYENYISTPKFKCLYKTKKRFSVLVKEFDSSPYFSVIDTDLFAVVKINPKFSY